MENVLVHLVRKSSRQTKCDSWIPVGSEFGFTGRTGTITCILKLMRLLFKYLKTPSVDILAHTF